MACNRLAGGCITMRSAPVGSGKDGGKSMARVEDRSRGAQHSLRAQHNLRCTVCMHSTTCCSPSASMYSSMLLCGPPYSRRMSCVCFTLQLQRAKG